MDTVACVFSIAELWLIDACVRHEVADQERWKYPPASKELTVEIALAINACVEGDLKEYTLLLSERDLLVLDYNIRQGHKNMEGAKGQDILLKVFHALSQLALGYEIGGTDQTYKSATEERKEDSDNAPTKSSSDEDANADEDTDPKP